MAVDQQRLMGDLGGQAGAHHFAMFASAEWGRPWSLRHSASSASRRAARTWVSHSTSGKAHALEAADRLPERVPLAGVFEGFVQRGPRRPQADQRDQGPGVVKALHHLDEAAALRADQPLAPHWQLQEVQRGAPDRPVANGERVALHSWAELSST